MGRSTPQTQAKRRREQEKKEKRRAKDERRAARKAGRESTTEASPDTDAVSVAETSDMSIGDAEKPEETSGV